jgi:hypothetical protein
MNRVFLISTRRSPPEKSLYFVFQRGTRFFQTLYAVDRSNNASAFSAMNSRLANRSIQSFSEKFAGRY